MASIWDFTNVERLKLEEIFATVKDRRNVCSQFDKNAIINLMKKYGFEKTHFVIERSMANDWLKSDRWDVLMDMIEQYGVDKVRDAIKDMNKLENHSLATVEGLLNGSIPRTRKNPHAPVEVPRRKMDPIGDGYPTQDHTYNARAANEFMKAKGVAFEHWPEYFDRAGKHPVYHFDLVTLKPEYRS